MKSAKQTLLFLSVILFAWAGNAAYGQYLPPSGGENVYELRSPTFLSNGVSVVSEEGPVADSLNPAASAAAQRGVVDLSYIGLVGPSSDPGWRGHAVNVGAVVPTTIGVVGLSGSFVTSSLQAVDLGTFGSIHASFAKELYPHLLLGLGASFRGGGHRKYDGYDWSVTGDLGFIYRVEDSRLPNLRWGVVLKDFGKGYDPTGSARTAFPSPFTLSAGSSFSILHNESVRWDVSTDISFPSFRNVRLNLGTMFSIRDFVGLSVSTTYDLQELLRPELATGSFIPSFGVWLRARTDIKEDTDFLGVAGRGWGRSDVKTQTAVAPLQDGVVGFGIGANAELGAIDRTAPKIEVTYDEPVYIAPNQAGVQEVLEVPVRITDNSYVVGYEFLVEDANGRLVRRIGNERRSADGSSFRDLINRLVAVKGNVEVPDVVRWAGDNQMGVVVPDGTYSFHFRAWDDNGNSAESRRYGVVVDTTAPVVVLEPMSEVERIFSPNGDGRKDTITFRQSGSKEDLWVATIFSEDGPVWTHSLRNQAPGPVEWNGRTNEGLLAVDGVYSYRIESTDRAGNRTSVTMENIVLNTQSTPVTLGINRSFFSPNGDGIKDDVLFSLSIPVRAGIERWTLEVLNAGGETKRSYSGNDIIPDTIRFDGLTDHGDVLSEGAYSGKLSVFYQHGNAPVDVSPSFTVDLTPPRAAVTADLRVFSPDGDGVHDVITFFQETSVEELWTGEIRASDGSTVLSFSWANSPPQRLVWDGRTERGTIAPDGIYNYRLHAVDRAGNEGGSDPISFELNTAETPVTISREYDVFSPNANGVRDVQTIFPQVKVRDGVDRYVITIVDSRGRVVRTMSGRGAANDTYVWEGLTDTGTRAPDGEYTAAIEVLYFSGNKPRAESRPFEVDTTYPSIEVWADKAVFSPNGAGRKDTVVFGSRSSREDLWEAKIVNAQDTVIRRFFWKETTSSFVWDGTDEAGRVVEDGDYFFVVSTQDRAGNFSEGRTDAVRVDTRAASAFVTTDRDRFAPNGDGHYEQITFTTLVTLREGVQRWTFEILDRNGDVARTFSATRLPERIVWDGRNSTGDVVEGEYRARFTVEYEKGDRPVAETAPFFVDIAPPDTTVLISPRPFSPDGDGVDDVLSIALIVRDASPISEWRLDIFDPRGNLFRRFSGEGAPPEVVTWDGRSTTGELVMAAEDYPFHLWVSDVVANRAFIEGVIPVDVLVFAENGRLKIRISSITFEANSPALDLGDATNRAKNNWVLDRITRIFEKYSSYHIRVEGHAVSVYWNDGERAQREQDEVLIPLSQARAETVKRALVQRGISPERITAVGQGGAQPVVPHGDMENRWKNRRVEFILLK